MINKLKRKGRKYLYQAWDFMQKKKFEKIKGYPELFIIDIDNTLTFNKLGAPIHPNSSRPRKAMIQYVKQLRAAKKKVIYLSARDFRRYNETFKWLFNQGIIANKQEIFLVDSAMAKLPYLEYSLVHNSQVIYIDDLSYNHENGRVLHYDKVEAEVKALGIEYRGISFIESL